MEKTQFLLYNILVYLLFTSHEKSWDYAYIFGHVIVFVWSQYDGGNIRRCEFFGQVHKFWSYSFDHLDSIMCENKISLFKFHTLAFREKTISFCWNVLCFLFFEFFAY